MAFVLSAALNLAALTLVLLLREPVRTIAK
jgi:hypothetical protein